MQTIFSHYKGTFEDILFVVGFVKGEPFTQEEMDEMLTALTDDEKKVICYTDLIDQLTIDTDI